jgi:hypothetical protein
MRMAGNLFPPQAWNDFFNNAIGYQGRSGAVIGGNDPGTAPLPPAVVANVQSGNLFAARGHRV